MGKQLKKYFVAGLQLKGINYNSLLGTVFLVRSVGSGSGLYLGATSCKQTERKRGRVREMGGVITSSMVANRIIKIVAQVLLQSFHIMARV